VHLRLTILLAAGLTAIAAAAPNANAGQDIAARFEADTVYVALTTARGQRVELYTDTGGGGLILSEQAASRLHLKVGPSDDVGLKSEFGPNATIADAPALAAAVPALPKTAIVVPKATQIPSWPEQGDGFVGAPWFAGGVWTWDYPGHHLIHERNDWEPPAQATTVPISFKVDADGRRPSNFARVSIRIDGRELPMLLDTGAETFLTQDALHLVGGGPALRATSMMSASIFDGWRGAHPEWPFIDKAQVATGAAMIEVPAIEIAGHTVGPVWFTRRSDASFHQFMSSMMDARVEGALGGNALRFFVMTIDYPKARLALACHAACRAK
jgi:predicted aspartyl protease